MKLSFWLLTGLLGSSLVSCSTVKEQDIEEFARHCEVLTIRKEMLAVEELDQYRIISLKDPLSDGRGYCNQHYLLEEDGHYILVYPSNPVNAIEQIKIIQEKYVQNGEALFEVGLFDQYVHFVIGEQGSDSTSLNLNTFKIPIDSL